MKHGGLPFPSKCPNYNIKEFQDSGASIEVLPKGLQHLWKMIWKSGFQRRLRNSKVTMDVFRVTMGILGW